MLYQEVEWLALEPKNATELQDGLNEHVQAFPHPDEPDPDGDEYKRPRDAVERRHDVWRIVHLKPTSAGYILLLNRPCPR